MANYKSIPTARAGAVLTIDLAALRANYKNLSKRAGRAACAAAIKAEAYGLGLEPVAKTLWDAGCRTFFVVRPQEGQDLRAILPRAIIYVLDGLHAGLSAYYAKHDLRPALATMAQVREWDTANARRKKRLACALHFDSGINRLGLEINSLKTIASDRRLTQNLNIQLLMSHLACADDPLNPMNKMQLKRFRAARKLFPHTPASLANSSGIFLGKAYCFDLVRPGVALYGGNPIAPKINPMNPVVHLDAKVLQIRDVRKGETVGYSATWKAPRDSQVAILAAGYRDGIPRSLSSRERKGPAQVWLAGQRCPIIGRVSMDVMAVDVTDVPPAKRAKATHAELFGKHISIDEAAAWAGTISYEILTRLGSRYARVYSDRNA